DELLVELVGEVLLEAAAVERELAGTGHQADADDRFLAPADGLERAVGENRRDGRDGVEALDLDVGVEIGLDLDDHLVLDVRGLGLGLVLGVGGAHGLVLFCRGHCATWWISYGVGFCAAWGCSGPA